MKLLIIDDHPMLREGLRSFLEHNRPGATVLQATTADEGLRMAQSHLDLEIVVLDLRMPGLDGHGAIIEFGRRRPDLPLIILSSSEDPEDVRRALAMGALGYVPKSASQQTLLAAIDLVLGGELYVPPLMLGIEAKKGVRPRSRLTARQAEILRLVSNGYSNKHIAAALGLSEKTVKVHLTGLFKALAVTNRTQAALVGQRFSLD